MDLRDIFFKEENIVNILHGKKDGKVSCGYLFYSQDGITNNYCLRCLAQGLLCENNGCNVCPDCLKVKEDTHPDILEFPKNKSLAVADVKEIIEQANVKPMICSSKVIIINNMESSSEEAQNKLLKTIEEPPQNVYFLISTTNMDKVLPTIKSRLVKKEIKPFTEAEIKNIFNEYKNDENFEFAVSMGGGYVGKTLEILENKNFLEEYNSSLKIVCEMKTSGDVIKFVPQKLDKTYFMVILNNLSCLFRDVLIIKQGQDELVKNKISLARLKEIAGEFSNIALVKIIKLIDNANLKQNSNVSLTLILETLFTKILEVKFLCK